MSIYSSLIPTAHVNHNVFDRSPRHVFSIKPSMLVPFYVKHTVPNAVYDINVMDLIELEGMPKANFGRMSQNIDFFFVPYSQIWHLYDSMYYQRMDPVRNPDNVRNPTLPSRVPTFSYKSVTNGLIECYCLLRMWMLAKDTLASIYGQSETQYAFDEFFGTNYAEFIDVHGRVAVDDMIRNFDLLGYGNLSPYAFDIYRTLVINKYAGESDYIQLTALQEAFTGTTDIHSLEEYLSVSFETYSALFKSAIADLANLDAVSAYIASIVDDLVSFADCYGNINENYYPNGFAILSYLKIFSDYYRSVQFDNQNYSYFYNLDYIVNPAPASISTERIFKCLLPNYHLYKRDLYTGGYPNAQFGDVSVATQVDNDFRLQAQNGPILENQYVGLHKSDSGKMDLSRRDGSDIGIPLNFKMNPLLGISALSIRFAEAMQRWKEKNLRAGNRLSNQQQAMFGDRSRYIDDSYCRELGNTFSPVMIDDVVATADSANGLLVGEKGSKGSSALNNDIVRRFECHDFGVIIGIMYILPEADYDSIGFEPCNTFAHADEYPNPIFQNLGLEAVTSNSFNLSAPNRVINYLSRYWAYKADVSKVHGEFNSINGAFSDYVAPRRTQQIVDNTLSTLYAHPNDVDNLFYMAADELQSSDQFKVNMHVTGKDILPLSVEGLPY